MHDLGFGLNYGLYPLKLCTFSRVVKEKGIEEAIAAVHDANEILSFEAFEFHIYGQVNPDYEEEFQKLQETFPRYIQYRGYTHAENSVNIVKDYFLLLFPTFYEGEGFAGTLLDSFAAGVPVIASDWKYNSEVVTEDVGFLFHTHDVSGLSQILCRLALDPGCALKKKKCCIDKAGKYTPQYVSQMISGLLNG